MKIGNRPNSSEYQTRSDNRGGIFLKKIALRFRIPLLAVAGLAAAYFLVWPLISPTMSWSGFVGMANAMLKKDDHPVIYLQKPVRMNGETENQPALGCGPGQSVTVFGMGKESEDFNRLHVGAGDINLQNVRVACDSEYPAVLVRPAGAPARLYIGPESRVSGSKNYALLINPFSEEDAAVTVENEGVIYGHSLGVRFSAVSSNNIMLEVINAGSIEAILSFDVVTNQAGRASVTVQNSGRIAGGTRADGTRTYGIDISGRANYDGDVLLRVQNDGLISGECGVSARAETRGSGRVDVSLTNGALGVIESERPIVLDSRYRDGSGRVFFENTGTVKSTKEDIMLLTGATGFVNVGWVALSFADAGDSDGPWRGTLSMEQGRSDALKLRHDLLPGGKQPPWSVFWSVSWAALSADGAANKSARAMSTSPKDIVNEAAGSYMANLLRGTDMTGMAMDGRVPLEIMLSDPDVYTKNPMNSHFAKFSLYIGESGLLEAVAEEAE